MEKITGKPVEEKRVTGLVFDLGNLSRICYIDKTLKLLPLSSVEIETIGDEKRLDQKVYGLCLNGTKINIRRGHLSDKSLDEYHDFRVGLLDSFFNGLLEGEKPGRWDIYPCFCIGIKQ